MMKSGKTTKKTPASSKARRAPATAPQQATAPASEIDRLGTMAIGELQRLYAEVTGEPTRCPTRSWLVRKIMEAAVPTAQVAEVGMGAPEDAAGPVAEEHTEATTTAPGGDDTGEVIAESPDRPGSNAADSGAAPKLAMLDIPALQALYAEVTGRPTRSVHRGSLIYRIREAKKGKVPLGPRASRRNEGDKVMVLPVRMESSLVERLDEAWQRLGLRSRMELFRAALGTYFESKGELELAAVLAPEA